MMSKPKGLVKHEDKLYLWGVIGDETNEISAENVLKALIAHGDTKPLTIHINSGGGLVYEGIAIFNAIKERTGKTTVVIDGAAFSIASVIALAGDEVHMAENGLFMIHHPWQGTVGTAEQFRNEATKLDKISEIAINLYAKKTGLTTQEIVKYMDKETYFTADECLELGFIDKIIGQSEPETFHQLDLHMLQKVPEHVALLCKMPDASISTQNKEFSYMEKNNVELKAGVENSTSVEMAVEKAIAAERMRATAVKNELMKIRNRVSPEVFNALETEFTSSAITVDEARGKIIDAVASTNDNAPQLNANPSANIISDGVDRFIEGATQALEARAGLRKDDTRNNLRGLSLCDLARESLAVKNITTSGKDSMTFTKLAMTPRLSANGFQTTSDFVTILAGVANKSMLKGWEEAEESFERWTSTGSLPDFKSVSRVDLGVFPSLSKVEEGAEYKHATVSERGESVQLATYGSMFTISRQAIINDDLNSFTRIPQRMGRAAKRTIGNLVYAILTSNQVMADNKALFHTDHKNIGTGAALSVSSLDEARALMAVQKDVDGISSLNIRPKYLLVPVALQGVAQTLVTSEFDPAKTQRTPNHVRGLVEVVSDARLDDNSNKKWYVVADGNAHDTIEVLYLNGVQNPVIEEQNGFQVDGITYKVRLDAGVKALEYRTFVYNAGTAG